MAFKSSHQNIKKMPQKNDEKKCKKNHQNFFKNVISPF